MFGALLTVLSSQNGALFIKIDTYELLFSVFGITYQNLIIVNG